MADAADATKTWEVEVDEMDRCTEFKPFKFYGPCLLPHCGRRRATNPFMRGFWAATLAFMLAFIGWFAFAPLMPVVRVDIGLCDNDAELQLLPESERVAACKCTKNCKSVIGSATIASVSFDILTRFVMGSIIEKLGPKNTDCVLLLTGALVVACSSAVVNSNGLIAARFFVSCLGSTFVVNQFWNSILFSKTVVGTANATAGGWGNLGGGLTQTLMPLIFRFFGSVVGLSLSWAWRASMFVPAASYILLAAWIFTCSQDSQTGKFNVSMLGKTTKAGPLTYLKVCSNIPVFLMIFQYSACFGCELVMNNVLATHFHDNFGMDLVASGLLATAFGGMNLFARSLGGIWSDWASARYQMQGRLWTHFLSLLGQAVFLFIFGCIDNETGGWPVALAVLCVLSIFVNMAEGTSYAIVPYMIPSEQAEDTAVDGAGGTLGAVIATWSFYKYIENTLLPFKLHAAYVLFWAFTVFAMKWDHLGSMFGGPNPGIEEQKVAEQKKPEANMVV